MPVLLLAVSIMVLDQLAKTRIESRMSFGMSDPIVDGVFHITYVRNYGAAFGILEHQTLFFIAVAISMLIVVTYLYSRIPTDNWVLHLGLGFLAGGTLGNLIDRIKNGYVVDFFDFRIWPVFNMADIAIVSGVSCIIYSLVYLSDKDRYSGKKRV